MNANFCKEIDIIANRKIYFCHKYLNKGAWEKLKFERTLIILTNIKNFKTKAAFSINSIKFFICLNIKYPVVGRNCVFNFIIHGYEEILTSFKRVYYFLIIYSS